MNHAIMVMSSSKKSMLSSISPPSETSKSSSLWSPSLTSLSSSSADLFASSTQTPSSTVKSQSLTLWWLVTALLLLATAANGEMRANKCCGANEQLNDWLQECVPYEGAPTAALTEETTTALPTTTITEDTTTVPLTTTVLTEETTTEQLTTAVMSPDGLPDAAPLISIPWWFASNTTVYDAATLQPLTGEGEGEGSARAEPWTGARLLFGQRACNYSDMQFVFAKRTDGYKLLSNGSLLLPMWQTDAAGNGRERTQVALPPEDWCADRVQGGNFVYLTCPCTRVTCLNRCCNSNAMFRASKERRVLRTSCMKAPNGTAPTPRPVFFSGTRPLNDTAPDAPHADGDGVVYTELAAHTIDCDVVEYGKYLLKSHADGEELSFWIQRNGSVVIEDYRHDQAFPRHHICLVDVMLQDDQIIPDIFFCQRRTIEEAPGQENVYYSLLFLSGAFFLLLTLVVHALVPDLRRSAHAKALMCHCATLLIGSVTLTVGHLRRRADQPYCSISAFLVQFFFLSTFFWLNVMCFDLSWTFGAMRRQRSLPSGGSQNRRFLWYSLYAWGCPALVSSITLFMEFSPAVPQDSSLLPNIGARRCWFDTKLATLLYYYAPMALLLVVNMALFIFTVVRIRHSRRGTSILRKGSANACNQGGGGGGGGDTAAAAGANAGKPPAVKSASKTAGSKTADRQMLIVFTKLFCLMGVTWVTEVISWVAGEETFAFWYVTDAINLLRGVLIFVFFCCKPAAMRPLKACLVVRARRCCPVALRRFSPRSGPGASFSTQESSLSMPEMMDSTATAVVPAAPSALSSMQDDAAL